MLLDRTAAFLRLEWILAGLDGALGWGTDAAEVLAPEFLQAVPVEDFLKRTRDRSRSFSPLVIVGVDIGEHTARARFRNRDGVLLVVGCVVEPEFPQRILNTWVLEQVPLLLTPRLPMVFESAGMGGRQAGAAQRRSSLVVLSGVPGTGKSTLADALGRAAGIPAFSGDWLLGALTPLGGYHMSDLMAVADELLTTLAFRQLDAGQSAILDSPGEDINTRNRWRSLADAFGANLRVVVCVCSDTGLHRQRVEGRHRGIPGWHDAGDWPNVQQRLAAFSPGAGDSLTVDGAAPLDRNVETVLSYLDP